MNGCLLGLATAVPPHEIMQTNAVEKILEMFSFDSKKTEQVKKLYQNSGVEKRHVVIPDFIKERSDWHFLGSDYPKTIPGMSKRNEIYKKEAPLLAQQAAQKAIQNWGGDPSTITHIISTSCTGAVIPGIEFLLIDSLNLKRNVCRLGINFMGCFGAFKGLEVAHAFTKSNAKHRVLLVCTELCSLHLQADESYDTLVANSIFADGAAAAIIGSCPSSTERPLYEMVKHYSFGLENSLNQMGWEASDHGFLMTLSATVPLSIARHISEFTKELLESYVEDSKCHWAIHPGGKAILQVIEKKLKLKKWQTQASWEVLTNHGNMSSATFLFVLEKLLKEPSLKEWSAGVGFGPGLSIEGILFRMHDHKRNDCARTHNR